MSSDSASSASSASSATSTSTTEFYLTGDDTLCGHCCNLLTRPYRCSSRDSDNACIICSECIDKHSALLEKNSEEVTRCPVCFADGKPTLIGEDVFVQMEGCAAFVLANDNNIDDHVRGCLTCANTMLDKRNEEVSSLYTCLKKRDDTVEEQDLYIDSLSEEYYQMLNQEHIEKDRLKEELAAQQAIVDDLRMHTERLSTISQAHKLEVETLREKLFQSSMAYNKLRRMVFPVHATNGLEAEGDCVVRPTVAKPTTSSLICREQLDMSTSPPRSRLTSRLRTGGYVLIARGSDDTAETTNDADVPEPMYTTDGDESVGVSDEEELSEDGDGHPLARCLDFDM